jgi:predicted flap endonuclease-1-like 5' DNA nuclease
MLEVVLEILLWLAAAALLGVAIGWLARGLRARAEAASVAVASRRAVHEVRALLGANESARAVEQRELTELRTAADFAGRQAEALRQELTVAETARDTVRHDLSGTQAQLDKLSARLQAAEVARDAAKAEVDTSLAVAAGVRVRIVEVEDQRDAVRRENEQLRTLKATTSMSEEAVRQRLETLKATLSAAENGWDAARAHAEAALQQLSGTRHLLSESDVERSALAGQLAEAKTQQLELRKSLALARAAAAERPLPSSDPAPTVPASAAKTERDDLQEIRGIGPAVERALHRAGIFRYAQIAAWTREDILAMGEWLAGLPERIQRDRWTSAARRLHIAKYGSPP